ncbi:FAD/NAD(P)-binding domain-containing protein [Cryphonectria parasitica EP155]|uniref:FAD/NAD(P)-binding domain-containing protein n=1 Tax=Cryphonectria parasitica (strain ATCC 38755 / EP155) TaxID=660469 RepID=A0A9P4XVG2_CRYP1|nr:FAD/NAD(P)-binding domain-containing protein [Cryphonectria parasitica EP155]KAF3762022.1 FAD/NAD(P)-binding domain-containing protein [Cryphonectria parasitica EP155]
MASPKVLVIGGGVAGAVLALILKEKGYSPIVFEKHSMIGEVGATLSLMPNGIHVLGLPSVAVADWIYATAEGLKVFQEFKADGTLLGQSDLPSSYKAKYDYEACGISRTALSKRLSERLHEENIELREHWSLTGFSENDSGATAFFSNGETVSGEFILGCDGLHSSTRAALLKTKGLDPEHPPATYTGMTQTAGITRTPEKIAAMGPGLRNWYGDAIHVVSYTINASHSSWAITRAEEEGTKESWHLYNSNEREAAQRSLLASSGPGGVAQFEPCVQEMFATAERLVKFGLYDRDELAPQLWHGRRVVLVGDAAHPTSPHLGQGANQALEDCYRLGSALPDIGSDGKFDIDTLEGIFAAFSQERGPRTAALVRAARHNGRLRVVTTGQEDCEKRDRHIIETWSDPAKIAAKFKFQIPGRWH